MAFAGDQDEVPLSGLADGDFDRGPAVGLDVRLIGGEKFKRVVRNLSPKHNRRIFSETLEKIVNAVQSISAEEKIIRGRQGLPPLASKLTFRHGGAARSIGVDLSGLPSFAEVGSILLYPLLHEFGLGKFPKRAWLDPAIDDVVPEKSERWAVEFWERQARATR